MMRDFWNLSGSSAKIVQKKAMPEVPQLQLPFPTCNRLNVFDARSKAVRKLLENEESVICATWECLFQLFLIHNEMTVYLKLWKIQTRKKNYNTKTPLKKKETSKHCNLLSRLICLTSSPMDSESLESFHWSACVVLYLATLTVGMRACRLLEFSEEASAIYFRSPWPPWLIIHHLILYISCIIKQVYLANINMI